MSLLLTSTLGLESVSSRRADLREGPAGVGSPEHRAARDEAVGAGPRRLARRLEVDPAVHLEPAIRAGRLDRAAHGGDLRERLAHEARAAEARLDRHHQSEVELRDQ